MDNKERGALFKVAYNRAQRALKAGFYLEAIVLCESLILDRLSIIHSSNLDQDIRRASAGTLANSLKSRKVHSFDEDLWDDCLAWTSFRRMKPPNGGTAFSKQDGPLKKVLQS
jgi:hypothetical protein